MSGSGSSRRHSTGGAGGGRTSKDVCDLTIVTNIYGPVANIISNLRIRDELDVRLTADTPPSIGIFTLTSPDEQAGTIVGHRLLPELISCLQIGHGYGATVVQILGSTVKISVSRVSSP